MRAYYNDSDPYCCRWLRNLIAEGLITPGDVDERPIQQVRATDIVGYDRVHFFAGVGGWDLALNLAGWGDRPVWTGSCPCQPFSCAGKRKGTKDARHLWPWMRHLIFRGRPPVTFGEQVASADGREWLAGVRANLETLGYVVGSADLCAAGVSAPHIRQRLFWMAQSNCAEQRGYSGNVGGSACAAGTTQGRRGAWNVIERGCSTSRLADAEAPERRGIHGTQEAGRWRGTVPQTGRRGAADGLDIDRIAKLLGGTATDIGSVQQFGVGLVHPPSRGQRIDGGTPGDAGHADEPGEAGGVGDTDDARPQGHGLPRQRAGELAARPAGGAGLWSDYLVIHCRDDKYRRISAQPGDEPLAARLPRSLGPGSTRQQRMELVAAKANRVGRLRGYGNAISPQIAAEFIRAVMEL
jgi:DNA (cytosine-5)-methyltransferase 1